MDTSNKAFPELSALLDPVTSERFFAEYWERQPLHRARDDSRLHDQILTASELEALIADPNARYPAVQLARQGRYLAPETYTHDLKFGGEVFRGVPDVQKIAHEYRNGASVVLPALQRMHQPLGNLCRRLEAELSHAVHANAYLTPGNAPGFTPHYDTHDVLVLQLAGSKRWSLYGSPVGLPQRTQPFDPERYSPVDAIEQIELSAGDLLYLPRGCVHSAATDLSFSAHVTLGISVYTWGDLLAGTNCLTDSTQDLQRALPAGFAVRPEYRQQIRNRLSELIDGPSGVGPSGVGSSGVGMDLVDRAVAAFIERVRVRSTSTPERFRAAVTAIDDQTALKAVSSSEYRLNSQAAHTVLEFAGKRHLLPAEFAVALQFLVSREVFCAAELPAVLSHDARLGLARYLLEIGFVSLQRADS